MVDLYKTSPCEFLLRTKIPASKLNYLRSYICRTVRVFVAHGTRITRKSRVKINHWNSNEIIRVKPLGKQLNAANPAENKTVNLLSRNTLRITCLHAMIYSGIDREYRFSSLLHSVFVCLSNFQKNWSSLISYRKNKSRWMMTRGFR